MWTLHDEGGGGQPARNKGGRYYMGGTLGQGASLSAVLVSGSQAACFRSCIYFYLSTT